MYAVICSPTFQKEIEQTVSSKNSNILYKEVNTDIYINDEFEKISRLAIKYLIIDLTALNNSDENVDAFLKAIKKYRIMCDKTQIIILAPNYSYPNKLINQLVNMAIYNILAPENEKLEEIVLMPSLINIIDNPASYKNAVKWIMNMDSNIEIKQKSSTIKSKQNTVENTKTVTVTREKIIGSVEIGVTGTMERIGTTHAAISIAIFLKRKGFKVCVLEYHESNNFEQIKNSYEDSKIAEDHFNLNDIDFYPYSKNLNILDIIQNDYKYIILDLGKYSECDIEEFKRSDIRLIVSGAKDWELQGLEEILKGNDNIIKNMYYFNFADDDSFNNIKNNMYNSSIGQLKCYQAVYNPNPFALSKESELSFKELLKVVLPNNSAKNKNIFEFFKKGK